MENNEQKENTEALQSQIRALLRMEKFENFPLLSIAFGVEQVVSETRFAEEPKMIALEALDIMEKLVKNSINAMRTEISMM